MSSASSDSLASSRTTLPARLLPSPAATFQNIESQSTSHDLCIDCEGLLHCILIGSTLSDSRWETINSNQTTLTFYRNHLDGFVATLQRSAEDGCKLCIEYIRQLRSLESFDPNETYCLFQWSRKLPRCELQLALGDVRRFAMHVSHWTRPITINFYTRQQMDTRYSNGSPSSLVLNSQIPRLYVLPEQHSGSEASNARAHQWLDDCLNRHEECVRPPSKLPKRVLDLGKSLQIEKVKVYVTKGEHARYATLSYSWGQAKRLLTTRETLKSHCQGIDLEKVPQTLRDALYIAKSLGFRYIWIDALCIIQKDKLDFAEQVAALTEIYGNSTLNISASSAKNSDNGILKELPDNGTLLGILVQRDFQILPNTVWAGPRPQTLDIEEKFISSRGWVFQERLVSPATLHYTDEGMVWECAVGAKVEHDQNVFNTKWKSNWKATMNGKIQDQAQPGAAGESEPEKYHCFESWYDWICAYSERDLYDNDDKFPAIAGVAKTFASAFGLTYAAGLWTEDMISGMMWRRHNRKETLTRYEKYVAPSWSWSSVHGRLEYRNVQMVDSKAGPRLKILE